MSHKSRNGISEEDDSHREKDLLYAGVVSIDHKIPKKDSSQRNSYVLADSDQFHRGPNAHKLGNGYAAISDENDHDRKQRPADAEFLADEIQQPTPCCRA